MLANSAVHELAENGLLFPRVTKNKQGTDIPYVIIADAAYPLRSWLLKPYRENIGTPEENKNFNYRLSRARIIIECAFGKLKGRWRALLKRNDSHVSLMPTIVMACVILHNICEHRGEEFDIPEVDENPINPAELQEPAAGRRDDNVQIGNRIRNALTDHFNVNRL